MQVGHHSLEPVMIVGHGSSGTSILSRLIREHLRISFGTESQFIVRFYRMLDSFGDLDQDENVRRLVEAITRERWFERCNMKWGFEPNRDALLTDLKRRDYRGVLDEIFLQLARHNHMAPRWGDKTPEYVHDLDVLGKLFPDAKYIHLVRDGRDVALSVMGRYWGPKNIVTSALDWCDAVDKVDEFSGTVPANQWLEVSYEQLLSNPVDTFGDLIRFLDIDDKNGQLLESISDPLKTDLYSGNFDKWRSAFSQRQRIAFESIACDALKRHGYETIVSEPKARHSLPARLYWSVDNWIRKLSYWDYWKDIVYRSRVRVRDIGISSGGAK